MAPLGPQGNVWKGAAFSAAVGGTASVLGGGKFADGAATGAFTYLFNDAIKPDKPDFSSMTNQEKADWLKNNAAQLGIDLPEGVEVVAVDGFVDPYLNPCSDRLCGGTLDTPVQGAYYNGVITLYTPAFEAGFVSSFTLDAEGNPVISGRNLTGMENAVHTFGHEAAHSRGVDMIPGAFFHPNAEAAGGNALQNFRDLYCGGKKC